MQALTVIINMTLNINDRTVMRKLIMVCLHTIQSITQQNSKEIPFGRQEAALIQNQFDLDDFFSVVLRLNLSLGLYYI